MCKQVDEGIGIIEALPCAENFHAVFLEYIDFAVAKPFVQIVDTALAGIDRIHPQLKTARILRGVYSQIARDIRTAWRGWSRGAALPVLDRESSGQADDQNTHQNS